MAYWCLLLDCYNKEHQCVFLLGGGDDNNNKLNRHRWPYFKLTVNGIKKYAVSITVYCQTQDCLLVKV